jgi:hypothetical protein
MISEGISNYSDNFFFTFASSFTQNNTFVGLQPSAGGDFMFLNWNTSAL